MSVLNAVSFQVSAPGAFGAVHPFHKPIFTTGLQCAANAVLFIVIVLLQRIRAIYTAWRHQSAYCPSPCSPEIPFHPHQEVTNSDAFPSLRMRDVGLLIIPAAAYFASVVLAGVGMLFIPASICFMVQASCIVFTALCSVVFLRRKLNSLHIRGIGAAVAGVGVVSYAGLIYARNQASPPHMVPAMTSATLEGSPLPPHATHLLLGVSLTLVSQVTQALQFVSEEKLLRDSQLHPVQVMGVEGLLSSLFSCVALVVADLLPGADAGAAESWHDTLAQVRRSTPLLLMCAFQFLGVAGGNYFGLRVSVRLGSVFRTVLLSLRTLLIWGGNLTVYYSLGGGAVGERWDAAASPVQCAGFVLLLLGTVLYAQGSSAVARDTKTIVTDIQDIWRALSGHTSGDLAWPDMQLAQAGSLAHEASPHKAAPRPIPLPPPTAGNLERIPLLAGRPSLAPSTATTSAGGWQPFVTAAPPDTAWAAPGGASVGAGASTPGAVRHRRTFTDELRSVVDSGVLENVASMRESFSSLITGEHGSMGLPSFTGSQPGSLVDQAPPPASAAGRPSMAGGSPRMSAPQGSHALDACLVSRAVEALGEQRRFHDVVKTDVEREIKLRQRHASINEPSLRGTLGAKTSWVVPVAAVDGRQHRGASSFQSPFVPQVLRSNTEVHLERQAQMAQAPRAGQLPGSVLLAPAEKGSAGGLQLGPGNGNGQGSSDTQLNGLSRELDFEMLFRSDSLGPTS